MSWDSSDETDICFGKLSAKACETVIPILEVSSQFSYLPDRRDSLRVYR
jgi:hypothetical protein